MINQRLFNVGRSNSIDSPANISIDRVNEDDENLYELPIKNLDTNEVIKIQIPLNGETSVCDITNASIV
jgi:hypothetical protein